MISANDLRQVSITEVDLGYSIDEVNTVINEAASTIEAYENENKELYHKLEVLASKIEEYRAEEDSIKTALITAQKMADRIKKDSTDEAQKLVDESKEKAEKIVSEARDYSTELIKQKNNEADALIAEAEKKSNEAINSSQIVAQNILDQAKEISDELVKKSQEEKEAYALLIATLRRNAAVFIDNLKTLYGEQLDALNSAKLFSTDEQSEEDNLNSVHGEVDSLVSEIDEMKSAIPEEVKLEKPVYEEPEPVAEEEVKEEELIPEPEEETFEAEEIIEAEEAPEAEEAVEETEPEEEIIEIISDEEDDEPLDPMAAVEAFSTDEITPVDKSKAQVFEITEEPEQEEKSLFEEKLPFENYFNVKTEDAHLDKTKTISLIPPDDSDDDDDAPKFKGFFRKKK